MAHHQELEQQIQRFNIGLVPKCLIPRFKNLTTQTATMQRRLRSCISFQAKAMGLSRREKAEYVRKVLSEVRAGRVIVLPVL